MIHMGDHIDLKVISGLCQRLGIKPPFTVSSDGLVTYDVSDMASNNAYSFGLQYMVKNCLSKWTGWTLPNATPACVALEGWLSSECQCASTNGALRKLVYERNARAHAILFIAQRKIADILGEVPSVDELALFADWSNGTTFRTRRGTGRGAKMVHNLTVTEPALKWARAVIGSDLAWKAALTGADRGTKVEIVRGNRFTTVPKNAKTDRPISVEPSLNIYLQKACGLMMKQKLKRWGVNLKSQDKNRNMAMNLKFATIDLSSASDTMSSQLIQQLLPLDWWLLLDDLRCHYTRLPDGVWHRNNKFSSMGNGFTFELESLVFFALASATLELCGFDATCSVYGDDIIVPVEAFEEVSATLTMAGFTLNRDKSFGEGPFRESCGGHYFDGHDVTPFYFKTATTDAATAIVNHNRVYRWVTRFLGFVPPWLTRVLAPYRKYVKSLLGQIPEIPDVSKDNDGFLAPSDDVTIVNTRKGPCYCVLNPLVKLKGDDHAAGFAYCLRKMHAHDVLEAQLSLDLLDEDERNRSGYSPDPKGWATSASGRHQLRYRKIPR